MTKAGFASLGAGAPVHRTRVAIRRGPLAKLLTGVALVLIGHSPAYAESILGEMLKGGIEGLRDDSRRTSAAQREHQELLARNAQDIRVTPDHACTIPQGPIEEWLGQEVNKNGLIDAVSRSVFGRDRNNVGSVGGYAALLDRTRVESARISERNKAMSRAMATGGDTPVGDQIVPPPVGHDVDLFNVRATSRIENGLICAADVRSAFLRFPIAFVVVLSPEDEDGWRAQVQSLPAFNEADALSGGSTIRVRYGSSDLTYAEALQESGSDHAAHLAAEEAQRQKKAAQVAFENSPAGMAAAARERQVMVERQRACEGRGGTWGVKSDNVVLRVNAADAEGTLAALQACYLL